MFYFEWMLITLVYALLALIPLYLSVTMQPGQQRSICSAIAVVIVFSAMPIAIKLCNIHAELREQKAVRAVVMKKDYGLSKIVLTVKTDDGDCEVLVSHRAHSKYEDGTTFYMKTWGKWVLETKEVED